MGKFVAAAILAAALSTMPVSAKDAEPQSQWKGCGENETSGFSKFMVGPTKARALTEKATPQDGIERCTTALNALEQGASWQRRAALLRSRAKFLVRAKKHREALADLDAIKAIEQPDPVYARSFGVSLHMLRAIAHLEAGRREDASSEAFEAMRLRPWSERVAQFAYVVTALRDKVPAGEGSLWSHLMLMDSGFGERRAILLARAGDWKEAAADWQQVKPAPGEIGQTFIQIPNVTVQGAPGIPVKGVNVARTIDAAMAAAMAGRGDLADAWLNKLRESVNTPIESDKFAERFGAKTDPKAQLDQLARWSGMIDIAKAAADGDVEVAAARLEAMREMPLSPTSLALIRTIVTKLPDGSHGGLRRAVAQIEEQMLLDRNERFVQKFEPDILLGDLPDHEEVMLANRYQNAVKFLRANGFSVKKAKDGKTADVVFFGDKSLPFAIGEMALLRAAELCVEQGKAAFRVISSNDYTQTVTSTMYGVEVGPTTVAGHSTQISIEFVAPGTPGAIDAAEIRAFLAPIYIASETGKS